VRTNINKKPTKLEKQCRKISRRKARRRLFRLVVLKFGVIISLISFAAFYGYAAWIAEKPMDVLVSDSVNRQLTALSRAGGLVVTDVEVLGRSKSNLSQISSRVPIKAGDAMLTIPVNDIKNDLEKLSWVKNAVVKRLFPGNVQIVIEEREPVAIWQHQGKLTLVAGDGTPLDGSVTSEYSSLPVVSGEGAPENCRDLLSVLSSERELFSRIASATMVSGRRWNVRFIDGIEVKLPESGIKSSWKRLSEMHATSKVLDRQITTLDFRIPGRVIVGVDEQVAIKVLARKSGKSNGSRQQDI
jgi:cell division protein FtsQ